MHTPRLWNRSLARASLMGKEPTMNPTAAATFLLGARRVSLAQKFLKRAGRKRAHRGNPLPAAVGVLGNVGFLGGITKRFRARAEKRAGPMASQLVTVANAGNLTAARGLIERAQHPMNAKEQQVWRLAAAQLTPAIVKAVRDHAELIPAADQSSPENFFNSVMASQVNLAAIKEQEAAALAERKAEERERAAARAAARAAEEGAEERREARLTELGAAGLTALAGRGRRPARRRKRRRPRGRAFSF